MATAASSSTALKQWATVIKRWPVDKVRPENVAFQTVMQKRLDRVFKPSSSSAGNQSTTAGKNGTVVPAPVWNEEKELKQVKALNILLDNKYATALPLASTLRHPASNPTYYDDLLRELDEAPSRSYFGRVMNRLRGVLRFK